MSPSSRWGANQGGQEAKRAGLSPVHPGSSEGLYRTEGAMSGRDILGRTCPDPILGVGEKQGAGRQEERGRWPGDKGRPRLQAGECISERCMKTHVVDLDRNKMCHPRMLVKEGSRLLWPSSS